jgi:cell division protein FtsZ
VHGKTVRFGRQAISSPLLDVGIQRATGIVWNITGPPDLTLFEVRSLRIPTAGRCHGVHMQEGIHLLVPCNCCATFPRLAPAYDRWTQVNEAAEQVYDLVDNNANLIFGAVVDPNMPNGEVR